jgi:hypothetical protein
MDRRSTPIEIPNPMRPAAYLLALAIALNACSQSDATGPEESLDVDYAALGNMKLLVGASPQLLLDGAARRSRRIEPREVTSLSPNGSTVATADLLSCISRNPHEFCRDVILTDLTTDAIRTIRSLPGQGFGVASFTTDGSALVLPRRGRRGETGLVRISIANDSAPVTVARWSSSLGCPNAVDESTPVSGDATGRIVFDCRTTGIWMAGPSESEVVPLVGGAAGGTLGQSAVFAPVFSPTGDRVAYLRAEYSVTATLYVMSISSAGGTITEHARLPNVEYASSMRMCWAPSGDRIIAAVKQEDLALTVRSLNLSTGAWSDIAELPNGGLKLYCAR